MHKLHVDIFCYNFLDILQLFHKIYSKIIDVLIDLPYYREVEFIIYLILSKI